MAYNLFMYIPGFQACLLSVLFAESLGAFIVRLIFQGHWACLLSVLLAGSLGVFVVRLIRKVLGRVYCPSYSHGH